MPKEGDRVQDQRFGVPVDYDYSPKRTDDEIRRLADVQRQEIAKAQEQTREFVKPMEAMVGKPAPPLPHKGWVGGNRPDTRGKPYLVHFWMAGCAPCKGDMPLLKGAAENGRMVIGMHPAGTPTEEIEKLIREQKLSYPTFVGEDKADGSKNAKIGGYPAIMFPYAVLVDAQGRVAAHGSLFDLADKLGDVFGSAP
jgi:thiol-disulfide isomerase/thioredoxin